MNNILTEKEISTEIANQLGIKFEAKNFTELCNFIEEIIPSLDAKWKPKTQTFEDFWRHYEGASLLCFISSEMSKSDALLFNMLFTEKYGHQDFEIHDIEYENLWDTIEEATSEQLVIEMTNGYFDKYLETLKKLSLSTGHSYNAYLMNYHPLTMDDNSNIKWKVVNGEITGGGIIDIPRKNEELLIICSYWLSEVADNVEVLEKYGIKLIWRD